MCIYVYICFHIELNLNKGEEFLILINSNITNYYTYNNNSDKKIYFLNISLNKGENLIQFIYSKKLNFVPTYQNPVLIKNITIRGSKDYFTYTTGTIMKRSFIS